MAVVPKHGGHDKGYDPKDDLTLDQIHRFTKVANKVQHEKDEHEVFYHHQHIETEDELEESIETKEEEFVHQQVEHVKLHKQKLKSKRHIYASLAISLLILSMAMMVLFN